MNVHTNVLRKRRGYGLVLAIGLVIYWRLEEYKVSKLNVTTGITLEQLERWSFLDLK